MAKVFIASVSDFDLANLLRDATEHPSDDFNATHEGLRFSGEEDPHVLSNALKSCIESDSGSGGDHGETALNPKSRKNQRRKMKRQLERSSKSRRIRPGAALRHLPKVPLIKSDTKLVHLPVTSCGYHGIKDRVGQNGEVYCIEALREQGYTEVIWDGKEPQAIVDGNSMKIVVVMAGQPNDPSYEECQERVVDKVLKIGDACQFSPEELVHPRAENSAAMNTGVFHGLGTACPVNLSNGRRSGLMENLVSDPDVCRMAAFADASFKTWSPLVYEEVEKSLEKLYEHDPTLSKPFDCSVYPTAAFNFGPQVCCKGHRDSSNYPHSWCAVQALGRFNPATGGHLVIRELKVFIRFPAGSTILLPSALLTHGNTPVGEKEIRLSFTQFCPGGLMRWVDNDFQTEEKRRKRMSKKKWQEVLELKASRWSRGMEKILTLEQVIKRHEEALEEVKRSTKRL